MANVLNPETESPTLNTELELPTLETATEQVQPSFESTSNTETADAVEAVEPTALDADALTEPVAEAAEQVVHTPAPVVHTPAPVVHRWRKFGALDEVIF